MSPAPAMVRTAVLLAAGRGTRLKGMTRTLPKCMIPVHGRTILERAVEALHRRAVERLIVVTGHEHESLQAYLKGLNSPLAIEFLHSVDYASTNNIVSLYQVGDTVQEDFLLLESDLIFTDELLWALGGRTAAAVSPLSDWMDGTVLTITDDNRIDRMYLKNDSRPNRPLFKTINIYSISLDDWRATIYPELHDAVKDNQVNLYYEQVFANAIADGRLEMSAAVLDEGNWREVDTPEDLQQAEAWLTRLSHT